MVKLETDAGLVGWGEGYCRYVPGVYAKLVDELLKPLVIGTDPFAVEATWQKLFRAFTGRSGGMLPEALAAIDIAIWDIIGKALGQPLYNVFGHTGRSSLVAYAAAVAGWLSAGGGAGLRRTFRVDAAGRDAAWHYVVEGRPASALRSDAAGAFTIETVFAKTPP